MEYHVKTYVDLTNSTITQHLLESHKVLWEGIMHTQERQVREALIKLGWTPPECKEG